MDLSYFATRGPRPCTRYQVEGTETEEQAIFEGTNSKG